MVRASDDLPCEWNEWKALPQVCEAESGFASRR